MSDSTHNGQTYSENQYEISRTDVRVGRNSETAAAANIYWAITSAWNFSCTTKIWNNELPIIIATMYVHIQRTGKRGEMNGIQAANIMPKGSGSVLSPSCKAGVHMKTNVYMLASYRDCTIPKMATLRSASGWAKWNLYSNKIVPAWRAVKAFEKVPEMSTLVSP